MEKQFMSIPVEYTLDDIVDMNDDLARGTLRVAYTGGNRNGSDIPQLAFEKAVPTLAYKPVVAHLIEEKKDFGGHDGEVEETEDGDIKYVNITEPVGVVPERTPWKFEVVTEESGVHNYFTIDVVLWKRQKSFDVIQKKKFTKHSMEIEVLDGYSDSDGYHINDFKFLAFCLLGDDVEPCFEGSRLELFTVDKVKAEFDLFMEALRDYNETQLPLAVEEPTGNDGDIENQRKEESGKLNKIEEFTKIGFDPESLGLDLEAMSEEDVTAKVFELTSNLMEQIRECMAEQTFDTEWGKIQRYWMVDTNLEAKELYCYDEQDGKLYGFSYSMSGDAVSVDWDSKKRMKFAIVEFVDGEEAPAVAFAADAIAARETVITAKYEGLEGQLASAQEAKEELEGKLTAANEARDTFEAEKNTAETRIGELTGEIETLRSTVAELEAFKSNIEAEEIIAAKNELFSKWETLLGGTEGYVALKADMEQFGLEELETKLKCLFADTKANFEFKPAQKPSARLPVGTAKENPDAADYGGLYEKYGVKPVK
ncbi:MAG: hypothetical protein J6S14_17320 [Clostridia bacterium]|nr:hypothetical protein [Clostridia bacterium]